MFAGVQCEVQLVSLGETWCSPGGYGQPVTNVLYCQQVVSPAELNHVVSIFLFEFPSYKAIILGSTWSQHFHPFPAFCCHSFSFKWLNQCK